MKRASLTTTLVLGILALAPLPAPAAATPVTTPPVTPAPVLVLPYDFDGNGFPDLAVGAPDLAVDGSSGAGGVFVYPSSSAGPADQPLLLTRTSNGTLGTPGAGDAFGTVLASGDFDRDGYADLAVGQPGRDLPQGVDAGTVTVFYGSAAGLDGSRVVDLPVPKGHRAGARFGAALAAADLDGDGYADLTVGAPGDDVQRNPGHAFAASGTVRVYPGGKHGLSAKRYDKRHGKRGTGSSGFDVGFGAVLAVGDVGVDGRPDLVVGAPGQAYAGTHGYSGWISVCRGERGAVGSCHRPWMLHANGYARGWAGMTSLAVAHIWYETPQIFVGSPHFADDDPGRVWVVTLDRRAKAVVDFGGFGLSDLPDTPETARLRSGRPRFGQSLAVALVGGYFAPRIAVGAPGADGGRGAVVTIDPQVYDPSHQVNAVYDQQTPGVPGTSAAGNELGTSVEFGDHDGDGVPELDVGAPGQGAGTGAVVRLTYESALHFHDAALLTPPRPLGDRSRFGSTLDR